MASYTFYKDTFEERLAICTENGASEDEAVDIASKDVQLLLNEYETQLFIKRGAVSRIKRELGLL